MTRHWREYLMEGAELACFMVSALLITAFLEHPGSPARQALPSALARRALTGIAMGLTAASIVYSPWGRRSGAHFNPSVTLTFLRLGKIRPRDAFFYVLSQFAGGVVGIAVAGALVGSAAADPAVKYVATVPGGLGTAAAFVGELIISFGMMATVLTVSNTPRLARFTGVFAAGLVAIYITVEAPVSGMSMNPARSLGPALASGLAGPLWIYFVAPPLGMLAAADVYVRRMGRARIRCAKLNHGPEPCHFGCQPDA